MPGARPSRSLAAPIPTELVLPAPGVMLSAPDEARDALLERPSFPRGSISGSTIVKKLPGSSRTVRTGSDGAPVRSARLGGSVNPSPIWLSPARN